MSSIALDMKLETDTNLHKQRKGRKMFLCTMFLFMLSLVSASDDEQQSFRCGNRKYDVCDELGSLRTEVDVNTADRRKWNRYFQFVQRFHRGWEDEVAIVVSRIIEGMSPAGDSKLTNEVLNENRQLRVEMAALQMRLHTLESATLNVRSELEKEREARNKIENEVKQKLPSLFLSIPSNLTERFGEFRTVLDSLNQKMELLESQESSTVDEVDKQRDDLKKLQLSLSRLRSATLTAAHIIRLDEPISMADEILKLLNEPLDADSGDLERDLPRYSLLGNFSTQNSNSKALDELNSKVQELQFNMRILTDTIGKAMSNIKILEGKYNEALRSQVRPSRRSRPNYEFVQNHPKPSDRRPFDPSKDP